MHEPNSAGYRSYVWSGTYASVSASGSGAAQKGQRK
jgi:hypothetical protein